MTRILSRTIDVAPEAIDELHHVNNQAYLRWMQEIAVAHSAALGWDMKRYFAEGVTWVVRSHFIEYLRPAFEGDVLVVHTWVADMEARRSRRRYRFTRESDGAEVVRAETLWAFVDLETGRPRAIMDAVRADFPVVGDDPFTEERS